MSDKPDKTLAEETGEQSSPKENKETVSSKENREPVSSKEHGEPVSTKENGEPDSSKENGEPVSSNENKEPVPSKANGKPEFPQEDEDIDEPTVELLREEIIRHDSMSSPTARAKRKNLRKQQTRHDSERSTGSGNVFYRRPPRIRQDSEMSNQSYGSATGRRRPSFRRQSSFGLPHIDSYKSLMIGSEEDIKSQKEGDADFDIQDILGVPWWTSRRFCLSIICFCGFFCLYALRVNLSIAIVCMVRDLSANTQGSGIGDNSSVTVNNFSFLNVNGEASTPKHPKYTFDNNTDYNEPNAEKQCPAASAGKFVKGEFLWEKSLQGLILGAFFWGYTALQLPGGWLAERFGPRVIISIGMVGVTVFTLLTPVSARASPYLLIVCRVLIGIGEAVMYPGAQVLWAKWSPPEERSRLVGFSFGGTQLGNALSFPIGSFLCAYGFDGGWPSVFYVLGIVCGVWCVVWIIFVRDSPEQVKNISEVEKNYILNSLGNTEEVGHSHKHSAKPWKAILTSGAVWAILLANACGNYGAYMLLTQMPTYMKEVLKFDIKSNGLFSMIPYLAFWLNIVLGGISADFLIAREILSIGNTRKLCCGIGMFGPAIFLVVLGYMDCFRQTEAVVLLSLSMALCGFQFSSFFINHGDIAPKYAGTIFGITNTGASIPGILAPYVVGAVTPNKTQKEWQVAFYIAAVVYCIGAIAYFILAKGEVQPWAEKDHKDGTGMPLTEISEESQGRDDQSNSKI